MPDLLACLGSERLFVQPQRACGLGLLCHVPGGPHRVAMRQVLFSYAAVDQSAYWSAWRACGGAEQGLVFESGDPVVPAAERVITYPSRWGRVWLALRGLCRALRDALFPPAEKRDGQGT